MLLSLGVMLVVGTFRLVVLTVFGIMAVRLLASLLISWKVTL
jgi:hypothetical protein